MKKPLPFNFHSLTSRKTHSRFSAGFTLVEMLVVVAIVMIVAGILIFRYDDFGSNVSIRALAQQMALSIRKGQTYATSARSAGVIANTADFPSYGLAFNLQDDTPALKSMLAASNKRFVLFADIAPAGQMTVPTYDNKDATCGSPQSGNECVEAFTITSGDTISQICTGRTSTFEGDCKNNTSANVIFHRPVPDAKIYLNGNSQEVSDVEIVISNQKGTIKKTITIWNTGQISVN